MKKNPSPASLADKKSSRQLLAGGIACLLALTGFSLTAQAVQGDAFDIVIRDGLASIQPAVIAKGAVKKPALELNTANSKQLAQLLSNLVTTHPADAAIYVDRVVNPDGWTVAVDPLTGIGVDNSGHAKAGDNVKIAGALANAALTALGISYTDQQAKDIVDAALHGFASPGSDVDRSKMAAAIGKVQPVTHAAAIAEAAVQAGSGIAPTSADIFSKNYLAAVKKTVTTGIDAANIASSLASAFTVASITTPADAALVAKADVINQAITNLKGVAGASQAIVAQLTQDVLTLNSGASTADKDTFVVNFGAKLATEKIGTANIGVIAAGLSSKLSAAGLLPSADPIGSPSAVSNLATALATGLPKKEIVMINGLLSGTFDSDTVGQVAGSVAVAPSVNVKDAGKIAGAAGAFVIKNDLFEIADGMATTINSVNMVTAGPLIAGALGLLVDKNAANVNQELAAIISSLTSKIGGNAVAPIQKTVDAALKGAAKAGVTPTGVALTALQSEILKAFIAGSVAAGVSSSDTTTIVETLITKEFKQKASTLTKPNATYDALHALANTANWGTYTFGEVVMGETNDAPI